MNTSKAISVTLAVIAVAALSVGTMGFTSVSADRPVSVNVVEKDDAYVGVVACEKSNGNGNGANPMRVWVTNRYTDAFTVERIEGDRTTTPTKKIQTGKRVRINPAFGADTVTVYVNSNGFSATVTADVYAKSECPLSPNDKTNTGKNGNK
ncbi:hypothetical protein [Salarchaeum japonicum]|uniref:hypothetical protein n=1 Tax=Salarchaeum japonicum TaxID=555573 RepID=UPI003C73AC82